MAEGKLNPEQAEEAGALVEATYDRLADLADLCEDARASSVTMAVNTVQDAVNRLHVDIKRATA